MTEREWYECFFCEGDGGFTTEITGVVAVTQHSLAEALKAESRDPENFPQTWDITLGDYFERKAAALISILQAKPEEEEEEPLWGKGGPKKGQVITIKGTNMQTRWNGAWWELVE